MARDIFRRRWYPPVKKRFFIAPSVNTNVNLTGVQATTSAGSFTPDVNVTLTGQQATTAVGSPEAGISANVNLTGQQATTAVGIFEITLSPNIHLTGQQATTAAGSFVKTVGVNLTGQHATTSAGSLEPVLGRFLILPGQHVTTSAGTFQKDVSQNVHLVGQHVTGSVGSFTGNITKPLVGQQAQTAHGILVGSGGTFDFNLTGVQATTHAAAMIPDVVVHLVGQPVTSHAGKFTFTEQSGPRTFFIASIEPSPVQTSVVMFPTSDSEAVTMVAGTGYVIGSSQYYTIGEVIWNNQVRTLGVDYEFYNGLTHIIQILDDPHTISGNVTLIYDRWNIGVRAGFQVTAYPVPFSFTGTSIVAEQMPVEDEFFTVSYSSVRPGTNPQSLFGLYPLMVDDMLTNHLLYDEPLGFQTSRPECYQVVDTSDWNIYEWNGSVWNVVDVVNVGQTFYVRTLRQIWENSAGTAVLKYSAGDGLNVHYPQVVQYPPFGEGVGKNLLVDGFDPDAPTKFPAAYQICSTPGQYGSVCQDQSFNFDFDFDFDG